MMAEAVAGPKEDSSSSEDEAPAGFTDDMGNYHSLVLLLATCT